MSAEVMAVLYSYTEALQVLKELRQGHADDEHMKHSVSFAQSRTRYMK